VEWRFCGDTGRSLFTKQSAKFKQQVQRGVITVMQ
jgi:hypothetical protein